MKLRPYPAYKDSGLPWLGKIPAHWEVRRNGRLFAQRVEMGFPDLPILEVSLRTSVHVRDLDNTKRKQLMSNREQYKRAAHGDIAYNMMRMWQGAVGVVPTDGLVSPAYVVALPFPETDGRYYSYLFRTAAYMNEVNKYSRGIVTDRNRLYWDEFKQMPSTFPPPGEQRKIANILDSHDRTVRRFIRAKRRLIELLNEQKQAILHRAVTRGLDPNVRLKPSGIDWLGDVPEHWEVLWLGRILRVQSGEMIPAEDERPEGFLIYGGNGVRGYTFKWNSEGPMVLLGRVGAKCGCVHLVNGHFWASEHALRVYPLRTINLEFLALLLEDADLNRLAIRTAQPLINSSIVRDFLVALPHHEDQRELVLRVAEEIKPLDETIARAQREIDLIREYRTRLIADVVTGKLDVRGVELPALDEAAVLDDFEEDEVADLAEETGEVEADEEEDGD